MAEETLRQTSIQDVTWLLMAVIRQAYSENWEQKLRIERLEKLEGLLEKTIKTWTKESMDSEEVSVIKNKPSTVHLRLQEKYLKSISEIIQT